MSTSQQRGQGWRPRDESRSQDYRPVPDPTVLTTAASVRLEETLRALIKAEIDHLAALTSEQFAGIVTQFADLKARTAEQKKDTEARSAEQKQDTKNALDAALSAAKEAVALQTVASDKSIAKSETATTERIKANETLLQTSTDALNDKISDLKDRIVALEAIKLGVSEGAAGVRQTGADSRAMMLGVIAVISTVIAVVALLKS